MNGPAAEPRRRARFVPHPLRYGLQPPYSAATSSAARALSSTLASSTNPPQQPVLAPRRGRARPRAGRH
ncbi:hypothetical protein RM717_05800 [Streptomyces griseus]|uniref:Uncharacterized protein n=1 Tax=Streptomyces stephensoniae TaxID=3375367 RepID=A0ABU2VWN0_9ACTN|nr:hypothetical protein [Streptomyces griseus]MDT0490012.1 hypothetical protein [Streptomyces griseus]